MHFKFQLYDEHMNSGIYELARIIDPRRGKYIISDSDKLRYQVFISLDTIASNG